MIDINVTMKQIINLNPCYDPTKHAPIDWKGTLLDILEHDDIRPQDKIWVVLRLLPRNLVECFAIDCALGADSNVAHVAHAARAARAARAAYAVRVAAAAAARAAAADAQKQEKENQVDALIMLIKMELGEIK